MPVGERPQLIPPEDVAAEVLHLVTEANSGGRVVAMGAGRPPWMLFGNELPA